jgi:hypothetical protein
MGNVETIRHLKRVIEEAERIVEWQQEVYTALHNINAEWIVSGTISLDRLPDIPRSRIPDFFSSPFWTNIPDKPSTFPPSAHASSHEYGGSDPVRNLDYLAIRGTTVIDSSRNLLNIKTEMLAGQTADPYLVAGRIWFRSDLKQIRWSPDGTAVKQMYPADWSDITNKPSTFPPSAHTHYRGDITNFWSSPFWTNIPDKPSTFPPSAHASSHASRGADAVSLDASQITSGTFGSDRLNLSAIAQNIIPDAGYTRNLGSSSCMWNVLYVGEVQEPLHDLWLDTASSTRRTIFHIGGSEVAYIDINGMHILTDLFTPSLSSPSTQDLDFKPGGTLSWVMNTQGHLTPTPDATRDIGNNLYRVNNLWVVTVHSGDIVFTEKSCPVCGERFKEGDALVNYVKEVSEEGVRTVPAHLRCCINPESNASRVERA